MAKPRKFVRLQVAGPWLSAFMHRSCCLGITMPWRTAYVAAHADNKVIRHELVHLAQIRRHGDVRFWVTYAYYAARYGYSANPYETQADRLAGTASYRQ